jgi:HAD superfamily hydrolase (TIGR01549 family)
MEAVLFDLIDTLVFNKGPNKNRHLSEFLRKEGYEIYYQEVEGVRSYMGFIDYPKGRIRSLREYCEVFLKRLEIETKPGLVERLMAAYKETVQFELFPDAKPAFDAIKKKSLKTAIVTTCRPWEYVQFLEKNGLRMDFYYSSPDMGGAVKPNPLCYTGTAKKLGVLPKGCLMVGDNPEQDVLGPKRTGMRGILLCRDGKKECPEADGVITTLAGLKDYL